MVYGEQLSNLGVWEVMPFYLDSSIKMCGAIGIIFNICAELCSSFEEVYITRNERSKLH